MGRKRVRIRQRENGGLFDIGGRPLDLDEVAEMVRGGREVQVLDAETGSDVTSAVLTRIIMQSAKLSAGFPLDILPQIITASGQLSPETASKYVEAMSAAYQAAFRSFAPQINPFSFVQNVVSMAMRSTAGGGPWHDASAAQEPDMDELRRKIEELQSDLGERRAAPPARKRRRASPLSKS
jgi:polyhydroxyalkanoate synthesis regulator protein